ncbi:hypothetical protein [Streptomyces sp. GbtcB6]|uniref:hypothetical protein n=1 Tax=Streptomyces sp. GbtcB6 TaxID=2824751 RepID=UPI001C2F2DCD|nr:hypothetical protein [Streptomyces sp. GbtcB6]
MAAYERRAARRYGHFAQAREVFETGHGWAPIPLAGPARADFHRRFLQAQTTAR